jgi:ABC-2 type transport system permease protein
MTAILTLIEREIVRFYRQRSRVIGALLTPLLFWLFIGAGIGNTFGAGEPAGQPGRSSGFLEYFFPGTLVLIVLFTAIFSTISIIEDRREGFLQSVLVAPISRLSMAGAKILGGTLLALMQAALFLALAPFAGIPLSIPAVLLTLGILSLVAIGLTGLGFIIAWQMDSTQGFHAIMNLFLIPLWLLSGAAFPASGAQGWLRVGIALNPVTYGVSAVRRALYSGQTSRLPGIPSFEVSILVTILFAFLMLGVSGWVAGRRAAVAG